MRLGGQQQTEISKIDFFHCYVLFEKNFIVIYMLDNLIATTHLCRIPRLSVVYYIKAEFYKYLPKKIFKNH